MVKNENDKRKTVKPHLGKKKNDLVPKHTKRDVSKNTQYYESIGLYLLSRIYPRQFNFEMIMKNRNDPNIFPEFEVNDLAVEIGRLTDKILSMETSIWNEICITKTDDELNNTITSIKNKGKYSKSIVENYNYKILNGVHVSCGYKYSDEQLINIARENVLLPKTNKLLKNKDNYSHKEYRLILICNEEIENEDNCRILFNYYLKQFKDSTFDRIFINYLGGKLIEFNCKTNKVSFYKFDEIPYNYIIYIWENCGWFKLQK